MAWRAHDLDRGHFTHEQMKYFQAAAVWLCIQCEDVGAENGKRLALFAQDEKKVVHRIHAIHSARKSAKQQSTAAFDCLRQEINLV